MIKTAIKVVIDEHHVMDRVYKKRDKVLFKAGAYSLKAYQRAQRYRKGPSKPGSPPSAHKNTGALLRKRSKFDVDRKAGSVVIGPMKIGSDSQPSGMPVPELLDKGGPVEASLSGQPVIAQIAPRPFVEPLFTDGGAQFRKLIERESL